MKKSILFMIHNMNVGGTEKSLLSLLSVLDHDKYDVTILMLEEFGGYLDSLPDWVTIEYLQGYNQMKPIVMNPPIQTIKDFFIKGKILDAFITLISYVQAKLTDNWMYFYRQVLKKYPIAFYDIAVAYAGPSDFITYFIAEKIKAPKKIQWIHFDITKTKINWNFAKKYYPKFDKIYCVSENSQNEMQRQFPKIKNKIKVFRNIVNSKEIIKQAKEGNSFQDGFKGLRVLTLGRLSPEKGQQMIPEVVEKLRNNGYHFRWYCIGTGVLQKSLEKDIHDKKLENHFVLLGLQTNPYPYLKDCDIYVQTSFQEGYGITLHEAKIFNKPIVTTNFTGVTEQINDGVTGKIVDISVDAIYNGLKELLTDTNLRQTFSNNLRKENREKNNLKK